MSALAPLSTYATKAGVADLHLNGIAVYEISSRWSIGASVYAARLHGDAEKQSHHAAPLANHRTRVDRL